MRRLLNFAAVTAAALCTFGCAQSEEKRPEPEIPVEEQLCNFTAPGAYDVSAAEVKAVVAYEKGVNQLSFNVGTDGTCTSGVTDVEKNLAFRCTLHTSAGVNESATISVTAVGSDAIARTDGHKVECLKTTESRIWLIDKTGGVGYILARKLQ